MSQMSIPPRPPEELVRGGIDLVKDFLELLKGPKEKGPDQQDIK